MAFCTYLSLFVSTRVGQAQPGLGILAQKM
jgi:hypothetical protein